MFAYRSVVALLLRIIGLTDQEEFIQRIGVYLINSMACQVDGVEKLLVGDLGAIDVSNIMVLKISLMLLTMQKDSWFKHILFRRKGLGVAYNATMPSPEGFL